MNLRGRYIAATARFANTRSRRRAETPAVPVRVAEEKDLTGVAALLAEQRASRWGFRAVDPAQARRHARDMLHRIAGAGAKMWVAERGGALLGHVVVGPLHDSPKEATGWWVMSLYVRMDARGCGIAEALVRRGIADAGENGVDTLRYAAFRSNLPSLKLAAKLGFTPDGTPPARAFADHYRRADPRSEPLVVLSYRVASPPPFAPP